jgi:L-alanine-DL-glutamate epimerase-like enolase superfamily enzyme
MSSSPRIERIEVTLHQLDLQPPFPAAWDTRPRRKFPATVVRVYDDQGRMGVGAGDPPYGLSDYQHLFIGHDALDLERHGAVLDNISFHAGRAWPLDTALWDLAGKILEKPLWTLMGGRSNRVRAYASGGVLRTAAETAVLAEHLVERGLPAFKIRLGRPTLGDDLAVLAAVREAAGDSLEIMVDCNQGWRMPWDTAAPWDVERALAVATALEPYRVYWMEEPLHRGDYRGHARLRKALAGRLRVAGGELTREYHEFTAMLDADGLDVYQPDVACTLGLSSFRRLAQRVQARGRVLTPHTWGNGVGLTANLHAAAGATSAPFVEFPYDPPEWTPERRDFLLRAPLVPDAEGWITLSDAPGLGVELDEDVLRRTRSHQATYV